MPITASKLRVGSVIKLNNSLYKVIEFEFRGTGKSAKMIQAKLHDIAKNINIDHRFDMDEKIEDIELDKKKYQYLYDEQELYWFMDPESFEQISVNKNLLGQAAKYLKPETIIELEFYQGNIINVALPEFIEIKVTAAPAGSKGSGDATFKEVTLENGITILAPHFIREGDTLRVDWAHNKYIDRVKEEK